MRCEESTTKKAWNNPLAPMAKCTREATLVATPPEWVKYLKPVRVCAIHGRVKVRRGWTCSPFPAPSTTGGGAK